MVFAALAEELRTGDVAVAGAEAPRPATMRRTTPCRSAGSWKTS
jgi:hypothetical protein